MVRGKPRTLFQKIHLYIGLLFGIVFVLLGLTGSAIAWMHELDSMLNPDLFKASSESDLASSMPAATQAVIDRLSADPRYGRPTQLMLPEQAGDVFVAWYRRKPAADASAFALDVSRQVMVDPYTLQITGERNWGEPGFSRRLLMPTLFHLHRYLFAGEVGKTVTGIGGLLMFIMAVSGIVLWCPKASRKALHQALSVAYRGSWPRFNYSLHRAAGFLAAPVFVVLGFSGWYFNLPNWVLPLVGSVATVSPAEKVSNRATQGTPLSPAQAMTAAQARYPEARVSRIALPSKPAAPYEIRVRQADEVRKGDGATRIAVDAYSGAILRVRDPMRAPAGDTFLNWLFPLHTGEAFGNAGRIFISCFGIVPSLFMFTGLAIWWKRRSKHRHRPRTPAVIREPEPTAESPLPAR